MLRGIERNVLRLRRGLWPGAMATPDNFALDKGISIDFREVWDSHLTELSPFCVDLKRNQVVFVRVPSNVDLTAMPFYYDAQRKHAVKVYSLGFDQFHKLAEGLDDDAENVGFLFSTGRCGSTLLVKLLGTSPQVIAISEPDIYSQAILAEIPPDDAAKILRDTTRVLSTIHRRRSPTASFVLIKLRSQCVHVGDHFRRADPRYRNLFLYRNAVDVVNSFYSLLPSWFRAVLRQVPLDHWVLSSAWAQSRISRFCPLLADPRFSDLPRSCFNICVLMWLSAMESAAQLQGGNGRFFRTILRYEDLAAQRQAAIAPLFEQWRVTPPGAEALEDVFTRNSQSGSRIGSRGLWVLNQQEEEKIRSIVAMHPQIRSPEHSLNAQQDQSHQKTRNSSYR